MIAVSDEQSVVPMQFIDDETGPAWQKLYEDGWLYPTSWEAGLQLPRCDRPLRDFEQIVLRGLDDLAPFGATAEELARKTALASDFVLSRLRKLESDRRVHEQAHVGGTIWRILPDGQAALGDNGIDRQDACPTVRLEGDEGGGRGE